jgi:pseudouridine kinase
VSQTAQAGVDVQHVWRGTHPTGIYLAVLNNGGQLVTAISDMQATDELQVSHIAGSRHLITGAGVIVIDGNLPIDVSRWVLGEAAAAAVPVVVEPVSVAKAGRLTRVIEPERPILAITPNVEELAALVGAPVHNDQPAIAAAATRLHQLGVRHVWVSRGGRGSLLSTAGEGVTRIKAIPIRVMDVTGAGDAMVAGLVHGLLMGESPPVAAQYGHLAAALTVASPHTVRPDLGTAFAMSVWQAKGGC